jgi:hypothetical protein
VNQPKQTVSKQTEKKEKTGKTLNFLQKISKYAPYQTVPVGLLFVSVQSKHRNFLFRYRSETTKTNVLFRIVPKLVSVVWNRNLFRRTPYMYRSSSEGVQNFLGTIDFNLESWWSKKSAIDKG